MPGTTPATTLPRPTSADRRSDVGDRLLDELDELIERHRARRAAGGEAHSALITAEVARHLAAARAALLRTPAVAAAETAPARPTG